MSLTSSSAGFLAGLGIFLISASAQEMNRSERDLRIMTYNVENFFDTRDDTLKSDEEFLPDSEKGWSEYRFREKSMNIFRVLARAGELQPPDIVCLVEVENRNALHELIFNTPLMHYEYGLAHFESPDRRGIDVALIYHKKSIQELESYPIPVHFADAPHRRTRDILYFKALTVNQDTLHIFVNHWPSRRGGVRISEPARIEAARTLRNHVDSLYRVNPAALIIITGDFNDGPFEASLGEALDANTKLPSSDSCCALINLSALLQQSCHCGTYKYQHEWSMLDQFIVSSDLLDPTSSIFTCTECIHIVDAEFMLENDPVYGGKKPHRTYLGPRYLGGTSDHLPVILDLYFGEQ